MAKYSFQDVIPPDRKKKIVDIKKQEHVHIEEEASDFLEEAVEQRNPPKRPIRIQRSAPSGAKKWIVSGLIVVIIAAAYFGFFLEGAKVKVVIKTESIPVNVSAATSSLPYSALAVQKEGSVEVVSKGDPVQTEKKATGTVTIYNNYSAANQPLIATTRIETEDGLIYHLDKDVTVPGNGSVEVQVTADQPGPKYNIDKTDFTITGFKGTAKYDKFYARSKTAMTGGFSGMMAQISDADMTSAEQSLQDSLLKAALEDISTQMPGGSIFFKNGGIRTTFTTSIGPTTNGKASINGKMSVEAAIFNKADVEELIAGQTGGYYHYDNTESLTLTLRNSTPVSSFISNPSLLVDLSGTLTIGQNFNPEDLQKALAGKAVAQKTEIFRSYPEIINADIVIRPLWNKKFPDNYKKIKIEVEKQSE